MMSFSQRDDGEIDDDDEDFTPMSGLKDKQPESVKIPDHKWECEHCTFVNKPGVRVCAICCKTPTKNVNFVKSQNGKTKRNRFNRGSESNNNNFQKIKNENKKEGLLSSRKNSKVEAEVDVTKSNVTQESEDALVEMFNKPLNISSNTVSNKKGMMRKISFWPGIKFYP
mgnify:CR=1 FL=1